jgi:deoxyribose-phosphate aldolase
MNANIEYNLCDLDSSDAEIKEKITKAIDFGIRSICVPYGYTKLCRSLTKNTTIIVANAIDYPLGLSDTGSRNNLISNAINNGAQKINVVIQNIYLANRKYDKIREDVQSNYKICQDKNVEITYYLEYRIFTHQALIKACLLLLENNINKVYVSTGYMIDNPEDNIIAAVLLNEKSKIKTVFNGNIWLKKHIDNLKKNHIMNISTNSLEGLRLLNQHL